MRHLSKTANSSKRASPEQDRSKHEITTQIATESASPKITTPLMGHELFDASETATLPSPMMASTYGPSRGASNLLQGQARRLVMHGVQLSSKDYGKLAEVPTPADYQFGVPSIESPIRKYEEQNADLKMVAESMDYSAGIKGVNINGVTMGLFESSKMQNSEISSPATLKE